MNPLIAILIATVAWFLLAAVLFFNPIVDPIYRRQESHAAVRELPQNGGTIAKILGAVILQCALWAWVYVTIADALPGEAMTKGLTFAAIITAVKVIPRDVDRLLLTTYPTLRMVIEFVIGIACAVAVGLAFAYTL